MTPHYPRRPRAADGRKPRWCPKRGSEAWDWSRMHGGADRFRFRNFRSELPF